MDKLHITLIVLLGISIVFLGISAMLKESQIIPTFQNDDGDKNSQEETYEVWKSGVTPYELPLLLYEKWVDRLTLESEGHNKIEITDKVCLDVCGARCIWLGYTYKNHTTIFGSAPLGVKESEVCRCECYVIKR